MNIPTAIVLCAFIICATAIVNILLERRAKAAEERAKAAEERAKAAEENERRYRLTESHVSKELRDQIRGVDRTLCALLIANPNLLESLPNDSVMKSVLLERGKAMSST